MADDTKAMVQLKKFMDRHDWKYMLVDEDQSLQGLATGENGQWHWFAGCSADQALMLFCSCCPVKVPTGKFPAVAEYLTRANCGLRFGTFELDWSDGRVMFRTSIPLVARGAAAEAIDHLIMANCQLMDRYLPGLLAVTMGDAQPSHAIEVAESDLRHPTESAADELPETPLISIELCQEEIQLRHGFHPGNN